ncbi:hypothetical protein BGP_4982 [Beggiatoa sp. PS]|nr:hypothetical protein BGP_4982 [Beggiatoa sp. PS]
MFLDNLSSCRTKGKRKALMYLRFKKAQNLNVSGQPIILPNERNNKSFMKLY